MDEQKIREVVREEIAKEKVESVSAIINAFVNFLKDGRQWTEYLQATK